MLLNDEKNGMKQEHGIENTTESSKKLGTAQERRQLATLSFHA